MKIVHLAEECREIGRESTYFTADIWFLLLNLSQKVVKN